MDIDTHPRTDPEPPVQQLSLLPPADVPLQFRLDAATRQRGTRHVAELRQLLAERRAAREAATHRTLPARRRNHAA